MPPHLVCREFLTKGLWNGSKVLDVGCGFGELMEDLASRGSDIVGLEYDSECVSACRTKNLRVCLGTAESLPFGDREFRTLVSSVVLPYVDPKRTLAEIARVLEPGGELAYTTHGLGYAWQAIFKQPLRYRLYGLRMLLNTFVYELTERRLPGVFGDTMCHRRSFLRNIYAELGLELVEEVVVGRSLGSTTFLCHRLKKI